MSEVYDAARAAAAWWRNALSAPKHDNGDSSAAGFVGLGLVGMLVARTQPSEIQLAEFETFLHTALWEEMEAHGNARCGVDYHPDPILYDAGQKAGFSKNFPFPWKTMMWVDKDKVRVGAGYQAPIETIWEVKP